MDLPVVASTPEGTSRARMGAPEPFAQRTNSVGPAARGAEIAELVPGARIGTVDKFQGQEAPVVIYSMATSSPAAGAARSDTLRSLSPSDLAPNRPEMTLECRVFGGRCSDRDHEQ